MSLIRITYLGKRDSDYITDVIDFINIMWHVGLTLVCFIWLGRRDSNPRMPVPKTGALPLGHAPITDRFYLIYYRDTKDICFRAMVLGSRAF